MPLLLLFVVMPVMEMWLLIEVGGQIGALATIALVLLTAMTGLALLRRQGFATLMRANQKMAEGQLPAEEMVEGICLAVGGALLLTPGFVTDAVGFACLLPGIRQLLIGGLVKRMLARGQFRAQAPFQSGGFQSGGFQGSAFKSGAFKPGAFHQQGSAEGEIIEGDFSRADAPALKGEAESELDSADAKNNDAPSESNK